MKERSAQACHPCRRRKVRCNGEQNCDQCTRLNIKCSFPETRPDLRSRRSVVRGRVIESCLEAVSQRPSAHDDGQAVGTASPVELSESWSSSFNPGFFLDLVADYVTCVLPTFPIISEAGFIAAIGRMHESRDAYALVHSLGAITWTVARDGSTEPSLYLSQVRSLYNRALDARGFFLPSTQTTVESVMVSTFMAKCLSDAHHDGDSGYFYLRDAITRLQLLQVDDVEKAAQWSPVERRLRERTHWLLFIQERFHTIRSFRPPVLSPLPAYPEDDDSMPDSINQGFHHLIKVFRMVDEIFVRNWLDRSASTMTLDWIRQKQSELGDNMQAWEEEISGLSPLQQVDLTVTRHWLRAIVWQMSLQNLVLFSEGRVEEEYMSILFPVSLSRNLRSLLSNIPRQAVKIHSTGILFKIFEITVTSSDILENVIAHNHDLETQADHLSNFAFLSRFLTDMPRFDPAWRSILESKHEKIRSTYPWYFATYEKVAPRD